MKDKNKDLEKGIFSSLMRIVKPGSEVNMTSREKFDDMMGKIVDRYNNNMFGDDGTLRRLSNVQTGNDSNNDEIDATIKGIQNDFSGSNINDVSVLMRRELKNISTQLPEMRDVIMLIRNSITESNVADGSISREYKFDNTGSIDITETNLDSIVSQIEKDFKLHKRLKNTIIPQTLTFGEYAVQIIPFAKIFAELDKLRKIHGFNESSDIDMHSVIDKYIYENSTLGTDENVEFILEGVKINSAQYMKADGLDFIVESVRDKIKNADTPQKKSVVFENDYKPIIKSYLENIIVNNTTSNIIDELGYEGTLEFIKNESKKFRVENKDFGVFMESYVKEFSNHNDDNSYDRLKKVSDNDLDISAYENIRGCHINYFDMTKLTPITIKTNIIGYYYTQTTTDLNRHPSIPSGHLDLTNNLMMRDRDMITRLASVIIKSFNKKVLMKNIQLKKEIAEILMAHKYSDGRLSFVFIPAEEVVKFQINEDEQDRGHSVLEPSLFPARMSLMLTMYNMLYTLNNTTTRVHHLRTSHLDTNTERYVQSAIRKFQSRRIVLDDLLFSRSGAMNKVGGIGEMVMPIGPAGEKAIETDVLPAVTNPIELELIQYQRKMAINGSNVPDLMITDGINEIEFAKSIELANSTYISTIGSYKIDFNDPISEMYQRIMRCTTDLPDEVIKSFRFMFNPVKQQELNITTTMINDFNVLCELLAKMYFEPEELEVDGKPTPLMRRITYSFAKIFINQLDYGNLEEVVNNIRREDNKTKINNQIKSDNELGNELRQEIEED